MQEQDFEEEKARLYSRLYTKYGKTDVTQLQALNFLVEELAATNVWLRSVSQIVIGDYINAKNERDQQADVSKTQEGVNGAPSESL